MTLAAGTKLGPYEIISPLGAGDMGEVYRARDTKLQRDVALKILPKIMARDAQRMARFDRWTTGGRSSEDGVNRGDLSLGSPKPLRSGRHEKRIAASRNEGI